MKSDENGELKTDEEDNKECRYLLRGLEELLEHTRAASAAYQEESAALAQIVSTRLGTALHNDSSALRPHRRDDTAGSASPMEIDDDGGLQEDSGENSETLFAAQMEEQRVPGVQERQRCQVALDQAQRDREALPPALGIGANDTEDDDPENQNVMADIAEMHSNCDEVADIQPVDANDDKDGAHDLDEEEEVIIDLMEILREK
ncbi:hypothetical protein F442_11480 [Phytophthora nicotianae P10297]|uniref:Uncharacterized protein n=2 Tax=Phytophthora nicotianae TaxID=4792 RepID=W2Z1U0_PHYNI|nr:hypothetical protein L916_16005 [Phytophthora nicotianae]ETP41337.1 hypothetical protein F442_11480 [Phytophthora nicotianae P10297]